MSEKAMTNKNTDALLPCPFCGGKAYINQGREKYGCQLHGERQTFWRVQCKHKDAKWRDCSELPDCRAKPVVVGATKKEAIGHWNTRAALTEQTKPVDVDTLANFIRAINGDNSMGAGDLAERIIDHLAQSGYLQMNNTPKPPTEEE